MDFLKRPILVTGASGGLGTRLVSQLLDAGFQNIFCTCYSNPKNLEDLLKSKGLNPESRLWLADLTQEKSVEELRAKVEQAAGGPLWGLIHLAGSTSNAMSWKLSLEDFDRVLKANLYSTFLVTRAFIPAMREAKRGRVITASSVVGSTGVAGASHYTAAKAGIVGFTKSLALEVASRGITANSLALGYFDSGMIETVPVDLQNQIKARIPLARWGTSGELAGLVKFLMSDDSAYMTGQVIHLNGGLYSA
jgi:NAD(P)-dependent dehydrogenase (short-subunit alcohol dehydrogenase family)